MTHQLLIKHITTDNEFHVLRSDWHELSEESESSIFTTWEWMYSWWKTFRTPNDFLMIIAIYHLHDGLVGLAPFYITIKKLCIGGTVKLIKFLGSDFVASDYLDIITIPKHRNSVINRTLEYLNTEDRHWTLLELKDIVLGRNDIAKLEKISVQNNFKFTYSEKELCPYLQLPDTFEEYLQSHKKKKISRLQTYIRALKRKGQFTFNNTPVNGCWDKTFEIFLKLHIRRMESVGRKTHFRDARFLHFHREIIKRFKERNWLQFYNLAINEQPIAMHYSFSYKNCIYFYNSGLNPDWLKNKAGQILFYYAIEDMIESGIKSLLMLRGTESYKYFWTKTEHVSKLVHFLNPGFKGFMLRLDLYLHHIFINRFKQSASADSTKSHT